MHDRTRTSTVLLFAAITLIAVAYAVCLSLDPSGYFFYRAEDRATWVYMPGSVAFACSGMLVEASVACLALVARRPQALWLRCLIGLALLGPLALLSTTFVVHMPHYVLFHHVWIWLLVLTLVFAALGSMTRQLLVRFGRKGFAKNSFEPDSRHELV